mmetsp:Transcript_26307/g.36420  ORF Transcript_26307/g.36420 Transcript_26307/m.36420 type:complete len:87 (-) Transcript_26307:153-413(-)
MEAEEEAIDTLTGGGLTGAVPVLGVEAAMEAEGLEEVATVVVVALLEDTLVMVAAPLRVVVLLLTVAIQTAAAAVVHMGNTNRWSR